MTGGNIEGICQALALMAEPGSTDPTGSVAISYTPTSLSPWEVVVRRYNQRSAGEGRAWRGDTLAEAFHKALAGVGKALVESSSDVDAPELEPTT